MGRRRINGKRIICGVAGRHNTIHRPRTYGGNPALAQDRAERGPGRARRAGDIRRRQPNATRRTGEAQSGINSVTTSCIGKTAPAVHCVLASFASICTVLDVHPAEELARPSRGASQRRAGTACVATQLRICGRAVEGKRVGLDADQFDWLRRILKQADIASPQPAETLARAVAATMAVYRAENAESESAPTFREKHDRFVSCRGLPSSPTHRSGQIRARLKALPDEILADIEERAERRWPLYFEEPAPETPTKGWLAEVPEDKVVKILPPSISYGGRFVPGRGRGSGRRSRPQYEPMILGVVRGSRPSSKAAIVERSEYDRSLTAGLATTQLCNLFHSSQWIGRWPPSSAPSRGAVTKRPSATLSTRSSAGLGCATRPVRYAGTGASGREQSSGNACSRQSRFRAARRDNWRRVSASGGVMAGP